MKILDDPLFNIFEEFERVHAEGLSRLEATPNISIIKEHAQNQLLPVLTKPLIPPNNVMMSVQSAPAHPEELNKSATTPALPAPHMLVMVTILIQTQTSAIALPRYIRYYSKLNSIVPYAQMVIRYRCRDYLLFQHKSPPFA